MTSERGRTVLVTGAAGRIGRTVCAGLAERGWQVRGLDLVALPEGVAGRTADLTSPESDVVLAELLTGAYGVVHLAGIPGEADWPTIVRTNIDTTQRVLEACRLAGVRRVVYASSNHTTGYTPRRDEPLPADEPIRPDTYYGVSKVASEALGALYADRHGIQFVALRIGTYRPEPPDERSLATWLSPRDAVDLVDASLTGPVDGFTVVWGISDNTRAWWSLAEARALGYQPSDDAEAWADQYAGTEKNPDVLRLVGGRFTQ